MVGSSVRLADGDGRAEPGGAAIAAMGKRREGASTGVRRSHRRGIDAPTPTANGSVRKPVAVGQGLTPVTFDETDRSYLLDVHRDVSNNERLITVPYRVHTGTFPSRACSGLRFLLARSCVVGV